MLVPEAGSAPPAKPGLSGCLLPKMPPNSSCIHPSPCPPPNPRHAACLETDCSSSRLSAREGQGEKVWKLQLPWNYLCGKRPVRLLWSLLGAQGANTLGSGACQRAEEFQQLEASDPFILWEIFDVSKAGILHQSKLLGSGTALWLVSCLAAEGTRAGLGRASCPPRPSTRAPFSSSLDLEGGLEGGRAPPKV